VRAILAHEAEVGFRGNAEFVLELADFHAAVVDECGDFVAYLIAAVANFEAIVWVDAGKIVVVCDGWSSSGSSWRWGDASCVFLVAC